jgi:hypothetical protein
MADQPIRVLFRFHAGVPFRQASEEAKAQYRAQLIQNFGKWKASGVKLVGSFSAYGEGVGGFAHHVILDVPEITMVREMNRDILGLGGIYQKHSFAIGIGGIVEGMWESA